MQRIFGKIMGCVLGFIFYGPVGAIVGFFIGHIYDHQSGRRSPWLFAPHGMTSTSQSQQKAFTTGVIVLGAKMAKADGRVTHAEIEAFKRVFQIAPKDAGEVGRMFDRARESVAGFEPYAFQLAQIFAHTPGVLEQILFGLFTIAAADSPVLAPAEMRYLQRVTMIFNFDMTDFLRIGARAGVLMQASPQAAPRPASNEAFTVLGIAESASNDEIKSAYRTLIRKHHPDRVMADGMAPHLVANAEEKMKRINVAYDTICKLRGIK
jgi:DnaJ like chaperone protein